LFSPGNTIANHTRWGQTFHTGSDVTKFYGLELMLGKLEHEEDVQVSLYLTTNELPTGDPIWISDIISYTTNNIPNWIKIISEAPVSVTPNTKYAIIVKGGVKGGYWAMGGGLNQLAWIDNRWQKYPSNKQFTFKTIKGIAIDYITTTTTSTTTTSTTSTTTSTLPSLSVNVTGIGTVTGTGINCEPDCSEIFAQDSSLTLTATPNVGSEFGGWSGEDCSGSGKCNLTMTVSKKVTATFNIITNYLTVNKSGSGSVSGTGISCGSVCSEAYFYDTPVTLTASPSEGFSFSGWSGDSCAVNYSQS